MNCTVCDKKLSIRNTIGTCRKHRGKSEIRRAYEQKWKEQNRERYNAAKNRWTRNNLEYYQKWRENINHHIAHSLRTRIRRAVRKGSAVKNLGCSIADFKLHLEKQFQSGMTWDNYGKWHIDHIKPLASFDLTDADELKKACHYTNMQPLWRADNIRKHSKLDYLPKSA